MKNLMSSIDKINTVAGLSDPILSGWSSAENVQTPGADCRRRLRFLESTLVGGGSLNKSA